MTSQEQGIKETKELAVALIAIAALLAVHFKDGVQVKDAQAIFLQLQMDPELKAKVEAAYKDIEKVKSEVKEVSVLETLEVIQAALPEVHKLIQAIKK